MIYEGEKPGTLSAIENEDISNGRKVNLKGNGDFRSDECIEFLKEADVVVTNPPFSLFREYVAQLMAYEKKFVIIGNKNALTYKEIFPLIKGNKLRLGYEIPKVFKSPDGTIQNVQGLPRWFTNLDLRKSHEPLVLTEEYNLHPERYPKYDNYDAIEVPKVSLIPKDYFGVMGVPITFFDKYCSEQFEIVGIACGNSWANYRNVLNSLNFNPNIKYGGGLGSGVVNGKGVYARILIRKKQAAFHNR